MSRAQDSIKAARYIIEKLTRRRDELGVLSVRDTQVLTMAKRALNREKYGAMATHELITNAIYAYYSDTTDNQVPLPWAEEMARYIHNYIKGNVTHSKAYSESKLYAYPSWTLKPQEEPRSASIGIKEGGA